MMSRIELDENFQKIDELIAEINSFAPAEASQNVGFRADLAGLLVVAIAATYENCVKQVMCGHATAHHAAFGQYASRNYDKLSSKIRINDLYKYCETFDPKIKANFKTNLKKKKEALLQRTHIDIVDAYHQILDRRNDFAHERIRNTTIEEATKFHSAGKRVLYLFDKAFRI